MTPRPGDTTNPGLPHPSLRPPGYQGPGLRHLPPPPTPSYIRNFRSLKHLPYVCLLVRLWATPALTLPLPLACLKSSTPPSLGPCFLRDPLLYHTHPTFQVGLSDPRTYLQQQFDPFDGRYRRLGDGCSHSTCQEVLGKGHSGICHIEREEEASD